MKENQPGVRKKIKAKMLTEKKPVDLMERTYGPVIKAKQQEHPLLPPGDARQLEDGPISL